MFLGKIRGKKFLTQKKFFGHFFLPPAPSLLQPLAGGVGVTQIFYWTQLSEYVQVVCRNTNGTCLKTPTFKFFSDFQLLQHPAKLAKYRPTLGQFWPKRAIFQISLKNQSQHNFLTPGFLQKFRKFKMCSFGREKMWKTSPIFRHFLTKKVHFGSFLAKKGSFSNLW